MKYLSSKKLFTYISLSIVLLYFVFVMVTYESIPVLHSKEIASIYYTFTYLLLAAVGYIIDTQSRKEPAFITLFTLPGFTFIYLLMSMIFMNSNYPLIVVLILIMVVVFLLGYLVYKKWIERILLIKNGYQNILFLYVIIHTMIALYFAFKIYGFL